MREANKETLMVATILEIHTVHDVYVYTCVQYESAHSEAFVAGCSPARAKAACHRPARLPSAPSKPTPPIPHQNHGTPASPSPSANLLTVFLCVLDHPGASPRTPQGRRRSSARRCSPPWTSPPWIRASQWALSMQGRSENRARLV